MVTVTYDYIPIFLNAYMAYFETEIFPNFPPGTWKFQGCAAIDC